MKGRLKNRHSDLKLSAGLTPAITTFSALSSNLNASKSFKFRKPSSEQGLFNYLGLEADYQSLLSFLSENCTICGAAYLSILEPQTSGEIYSGKFVLQTTDQNEFITAANSHGVNRIFLENVGFLEVADKKTFYILKEKEPNEICFYVFGSAGDRHGLDSIYEIHKQDSLDYFVVSGKTVSECETVKYCKSCGLVTPEQFGKALQQKLPTTLALDQKILFFIGLAKLMNPKFILNNDDLSQFSLMQIYLLASFRKLFFSRIFVENNSNFPIFNEFCRNFFIKVKEIAKEYSLLNNENFYRSSIKNSSREDAFTKCFTANSFKIVDSFSAAIAAIKKEENKYKIFLLRETASLTEREMFLKNLNTENKKVRYLEYQGIDDYETNYDRGSSILSFLGLNKEITDLFIKHPLSKERGLKSKDFSYSKSAYQCPNCMGNGILDDDTTCKTCFGRRFDPTLSEISWRGLWIGELMNTEIHTFKNVLGSLFPKKNKLFEVIIDFGLGDLKLGANLKLVSPLARQKLSFVKFCQQNFKQNDIVLFDGIHPLLNSSEVICHKALDVFSDLVKREAKLLVVSRTLKEV